MLCAIAIIDDASRNRLLEIQRIGKKFDIPSRHLHGHITLATYVGTDDGAFVSSCKSILSSYPPCSVLYHRIRILSATSIIVAVPSRNTLLTDMQREISDRWHQDLDQWTKSEIWEPHTTLVHKPDFDLEPVAQAMREQFLPFSALIDRIEFSKVHENGYEILETVFLK